MFSTLARGYGALSAGATQQSPQETIDKLCDRLLNGTHLEDRRAALLGLKGLSRDWKSEVGQRALPILLGVLEEDAPEDVEMAKAVVETLSLLCEVEEVDSRPVRDDSGLRNTDGFLQTAAPLHTLLTLLTPAHFYLRFFSLQLLGVLIANRSSQVQAHVLTAPGGVGRLVETLDDTREIIRNESLLLIIALTTSNADIQKLLAFEGAFDKLFAIVSQEGGIGSGGIVVQDCLAAIGGLLRWNVSNQNYFRETSCIPLLAPLLLFPQPKAQTPASLSAFAFQSWSEQKVVNAGLVLSLVRMLVGGAGAGREANQKALLTSGMSRCLAEMALASNAPSMLKSQAMNALADILRLSPPNQAALNSLIVVPLIRPMASPPAEHYNPDYDDGEPAQQRGGGSRSDDEDEDEVDRRSNRSKWRKGTPAPAVIAVVRLAVVGDGTPGRSGLRVRAAAANLFQSYVANSTETQLGILSTMVAPSPDTDPSGPQIPSAGSILLHAMRTFPSATRDHFDSYVPFFACLLFSHLIMGSETSKEFARKIYFTGDDAEPGGYGDEEERASLVSILVGNLMMAQREQVQSANAGLGPDRGLEWSRIMVGYLMVLSLWLWDSPTTVTEFLSEGSNLQVKTNPLSIADGVSQLIQPITQSSGVDSVVQGLCAFLLGICYEYNREPGPITRETLHPILHSRVGADQFVSRILRLREDERFRSVGPAVLELIDEEMEEELGEEQGLWFDYSFVEFLKTNYISVQRAILMDPTANTTSRRSLDGNGDSYEVVTALRSSIAAQTEQMEDMRNQILGLAAERDEERIAFQNEIESLTARISGLQGELEQAYAEVNAARTGGGGGGGNNNRDEPYAPRSQSDGPYTPRGEDDPYAPRGDDPYAPSLPAAAAAASPVAPVVDHEASKKIEVLEKEIAALRTELDTAHDEHQRALSELEQARHSRTVDDLFGGGRPTSQGANETSSFQSGIDFFNSSSTQTISSNDSPFGSHPPAPPSTHDPMELERLRAELERTQKLLESTNSQLETSRQHLASTRTELDQLRDATPLDVEAIRAGRSDDALAEEVSTLRRELEQARSAKEEADKEQEDLLVLLEDVSSKRKMDKQRMRSAFMQVSDDEDDDEDDLS
ncbi:BZ3500_MvSof-1268-A1-R1_Chr1-3g02071 [Microbotryum saponariae]|uniref:BZ3500_MvSof-1268-A1-R1_Chr1-3g02071 protein n=1 Tax=Microbotryum saponariae TaxID=289078 RepID=A0A2X0KG56_9BASI|nr:BZ3500_MvSof-1268-A1-R1_Chr1-3g02071 [Microbotryum saponariae]SCZ95326.1 BZ3501_MvSof-1269-A2-R1_Chr1-3g01673 [Microbotryum saponariae]